MTFAGRSHFGVRTWPTKPNGPIRAAKAGEAVADRSDGHRPLRGPVRRRRAGRIGQGPVSRTGTRVSGPGARAESFCCRDIGKLIFITLRDRSGTIQVGLSKSLLTEQWPLAKLLDIGDIIGAAGKLGKTKTGEITIWVRRRRPDVPEQVPLPAAGEIPRPGGCRPAVSAALRGPLGQSRGAGPLQEAQRRSWRPFGGFSSPRGSSKSRRR